MYEFRTRLYEAVLDEDLDEVRNRARDCPAEIHAVDEDGETPLHIAAEGDYLEIGKVLIEHGADVNARDSAERTPLHYAAQHDALRMAQLLIDHGAQLNAQRCDRATPLYMAAPPIVETEAVANLLIERGATVDLNSILRLRMFDRAVQILTSDPDAVKRSPFPDELLIDAIDHRHRFDGLAGVVELLLRNGAPVDGKNGWGQTALMVAAQQPELPVDVFKVLLENGADASGRNPVYHRSVIQTARHFGNTDAVELIQEYLKRDDAHS